MAKRLLASKVFWKGLKKLCIILPAPGIRKKGHQQLFIVSGESKKFENVVKATEKEVKTIQGKLVLVQRPNKSGKKKFRES